MSCAPAERLRWIADYVGVAGKAVSVLACVKGMEYSPDTHRKVQCDLFDLAEELEVHPDFASSADRVADRRALALHTAAMLKRSVGLLSQLCDTEHPPEELLEVYRNIECALVRLGEWNQYSEFCHEPPTSFDGYDHPFGGNRGALHIDSSEIQDLFLASTSSVMDLDASFGLPRPGWPLLEPPGWAPFKNVDLAIFCAGDYGKSGCDE